jgi:hypothetical protein
LYDLLDLDAPGDVDYDLENSLDDLFDT